MMSTISKRFGEWRGKLQIALANRASRNKTSLDIQCRRLLGRILKVAPQDDFMRDPIIDSDRGFSPEELHQFRNSNGDQ